MRKVRKYLIWAAFLRLWAGTIPLLKKQNHFAISFSSLFATNLPQEVILEPDIIQS